MSEKPGFLRTFEGAVDDPTAFADFRLYEGTYHEKGKIRERTFVVAPTHKIARQCLAGDACDIKLTIKLWPLDKDPGRAEDWSCVCFALFDPEGRFCGTENNTAFSKERLNALMEKLRKGQKTYVSQKSSARKETVSLATHEERYLRRKWLGLRLTPHPSTPA